MLLLLIISSFFPTTAFSQPQRLTDDIFLFSNSCNIVRTRTSTGEQSISPTQDKSFGCERNEGLNLTCSVLTEEGIISSFNMQGGMENNTATLEGDHELLTLQNVNKGMGNFTASSNLAFLQDGDLKDTRICEGVWGYSSIIQEWLKQEKQKQKEEVIRESREESRPSDI